MDEGILGRIAKRIKVLRKARGFTLQKLSERSRVSRGLLSKIENSRTIPSLPVFFGIIKAMNVSIDDFFEDLDVEYSNEYLHIRYCNYQRIEKEMRSGFNYQFIFSHTIQACIMEIVLLTVEPNASIKATTTDGFEYKYILSGKCYYVINNEKILLEEGDSLYFNASRPHYPVNSFENRVVMLVAYFLSADQS